MPLRKYDPKRSEQSQPMTEIRMSAASTTTSFHYNPDPYYPTSPSAHPVYGNYRENVPLEQQRLGQPPLSQRPGLSDYHNRTLSDLMTESVEHSPLEPPNSGAFPPFVPRAASSYSEAPTRSSSPFPGASGSPFRSSETLRPLVPGETSPYFKRDWFKDGSIAQLHTRDDKEFIAGRKRWFLRWFAPLLALTSLSLYWLYFGMRIACK